LRGDWTTGRADELRTVLLDAVSKCDHLLLNVRDVTGVSLPFYQLLLAGRRTSSRQGKRLSLEGPFPRVVVRGAQALGILTRTDRARREPDAWLFMGEDAQ